MTPLDFPRDIRNVIERACRTANTPLYGANFIHTDDGQPTASLGRLSGGLEKFGVYDDLIVEWRVARWAVASAETGALLGLYEDPKELRAGLQKAIDALYPTKYDRRRSQVLTRYRQKGPTRPVGATKALPLRRGGKS